MQEKQKCPSQQLANLLATREHFLHSSPQELSKVIVITLRRRMIKALFGLAKGVRCSPKLSCDSNHLFISYILDLANLTSRFGGAESFATSISLEKLDRSLSSSCPYFWRQFSAILAASQLYFKKQYKGRLEAFFLTKYTVFEL